MTEILPCEDITITVAIERYKNMVYGVALSHVQNHADADDVFQNVFLAYFQKQKTFCEEEHRKAWLIKTTLNYCKKAANNSFRKRTMPLEEQGDSTYKFEMKEENAVFNILCSLPPSYRTVLHLFYFEEMTVDEIGRILHKKPGTIRMRLTRGRRMMREQLKGVGIFG